MKKDKFLRTFTQVPYARLNQYLCSLLPVNSGTLNLNLYFHLPTT